MPSGFRKKRGNMAQIDIKNSKVLESREAADGSSIRRRRETPEGIRFTTYERIEMPTIMVRKRNGEKEVFDREKMLSALRRSVGKFFNSGLEIERIADEVVDRITRKGIDEIYSKEIGNEILDVLAEQNEVAYVRFASVFQEFKSLEEFEKIISERKNRK